MKLFFSFLVILFFGIFISSQTTISGRIEDENGKTLNATSVSISETDNNNVLAYAITNTDGAFSISVKSNAKKFKIEARKLNYVFSSQIIENKTQFIKIALVFKEITLKEVIIKSTPIRKKGDTLSYNVASFADSKDRSIADVLSKMPGIEVLSDGRVLYQGVSIQKYYIEGMDLLEGKYNLANQNLPQQSVSSVQILENHQPIKILDSLVPNQRPSLNIKLKNKIVTTGTAKLGIGVSPALWDANVTPMLFKKKEQMIVSYQANNIGYDSSIQLRTLTLDDFYDKMDNPSQKTDLVEIEHASPPNISERRYLDNNINLLTVNYLTKIKKDLELRLNISYVNDHQKQENESSTEYLLPSGNIFLNEKISNRIYANDFQSSITLMKNSKNTYFKNSFNTQINWESQRGKSDNNLNEILQKLNNPYYSFSNQLKFISPIGKKLITFSSFINYNRTPQSLSVTPGQFSDILNQGNPYYSTRQEIEQTVFQTNNFAEFTHKLSNFTLAIKAGLNFQYQTTQSNIFKDNFAVSGEFQNYNKNRWSNFYLIPNLIYKKGNLTFTARIPSYYTDVFTKDKTWNEVQKAHKLVFKPNADLTYVFNAFWKIGAEIGYNKDFKNSKNIFYGYILTNYKNLQRNNYPIYLTENYYANTRLDFKDPIKALFFNFHYEYSENKSPYIIQTKINPNGSQEFGYAQISNTSYNHSIGGKLSKFFSDFQTTATLGMEFSVSKSQNLINDLLTPVRNKSYSPSFKISTKIYNQFNIDYYISSNFNEYKSTQKQNIFYLKQAITPRLDLGESHSITLNLEHYYNDYFSKNNHNYYMDLIYKYSLNRSKIDIELRCSNLLNSRKYYSTEINNYYIYQSQYKLRQRQIIGSIKFRF